MRFQFALALLASAFIGSSPILVKDVPAASLTLTPSHSSDALQAEGSVDLEQFYSAELGYSILLPEASTLMEDEHSQEMWMWLEDGASITFTVRDNHLLSMSEREQAAQVAAYLGPELETLREQGFSNQDIRNYMVAKRLGIRTLFEYTRVGFVPSDSSLEIDRQGNAVASVALTLPNREIKSRLILVVSNQRIYIFGSTWNTSTIDLENTVDEIIKSLQVGR